MTTFKDPADEAHTERFFSRERPGGKSELSGQALIADYAMQARQRSYICGDPDINFLCSCVSMVSTSKHKD
jgi:hypothetical protein